jgi:fumarate reductase flavoprotein subunit
VVEALALKAKEKGVAIRAAAPVKQILKGKTGPSGVVVEVDGKDTEVACRAVVIASGGYANNAEWIQKYTGLELGRTVTPMGNFGKMGDGIRMAHDIGAASEGISVIEMLRTSKDRPESMTEIGFAVVQPDLWVNTRGERFCDETVTFDDTSMGNASVKQNKGCGYSIFDSSIVRQLAERGIDKAMALDYPPGSRLLNLARELEESPTTRPDDVYQADSIADLAILIHVNPATLQATVDEYNRYCDQGHDELFAKNPRYLRPIRGPRFYAVKTQTVFLGTMGGIKINERTEVLDKEDQIVPGLYAGGFDAGGMYGDSYSIKGSTGLSSCFSMNSGRLAANNALRYLGKQN